MDPAFESRIDIALQYQNLTASSRATILQNFLQRLPKDMVQISAIEAEKLMQDPWNGRQIKSAVKTARILAASEKSKLKATHLETVLALRKEVIQDMKVSRN
jgi:DNA-binding NtrC family response regulator